MKYTFQTCLLASVLFATTSHAQLKVTSNSGKVKIGIETPVGISQDNDEVLRGHVFGPNGDYRSGAKVAFGDFGAYERWGYNVFIGEYRDFDSDQMWLHGKLGFYLTKGRGDDVVAYYNVNAGNTFHFNCDVVGYSFSVASDARFKTNIKPIESAMEQLKKLEGVSYNLLPHVMNTANGSTEPAASTSSNNAPVSAKEAKDISRFGKMEKENNQPGPKRLGLIAQEVQKIFPELVKSDSSNYLYVDYIGLIPVMIQGMKEQEEVIDVQNTKIKEMESRLAGMEAKLAGMLSDNNTNDKNSIASTTSYLFQNSPNPFNSTTEINYFIGANVKVSAIHIFDLQGNMIRTIELKGKGKGLITINGSELKAGMYIYSLVTDGQEADVKRMTLIK